MERGPELCLAWRNCDSLLITAPVSSFGFWIGYLMRESTPKYYILKLDGTPIEKENFPKTWIPIN